MPIKKFILSFVLLVLGVSTTFAQTDTTDAPVKQQLPTGPPGAPQTPVAPPRQAPVVTPQPPAEPAVVDEQLKKEQEEEQRIEDSWLKEKYKRRFFLGSSGGFSFTSDNIYGDRLFLEISPFLGYRLSNRFSAGPGFTYQFLNTSIGKFHNYGTKFFVQGTVFNSVFSESDQLMIHAEYEVLNVEGYDQRTSNRVRVTFNTVLGGLGYRQNISDRVATDLYVLYNFSNDFFSPYGPLVIRAAFLVNL